MWYNIDFRKLVVLLAPGLFRKLRAVNLLFCIIEPITYLHYTWIKKRDFDWYRINHNGQRCKLRKILNDNLDPIHRRIIIDDGDTFLQEYIYTDNELEDVFLDDTLFVYMQEESYATGVDFVVKVPYEIIESSIHVLNYLINFYRLAGKRFRIESL